MCLLSQLALFALPVLFFAGCVTLWHPSAYQTGKVMAQGATEIEAHAWAFVPTNVSFAVAPFDGLETRVGYGYAGSVEAFDYGHVKGWELSLTKRISEAEHMFTSASLAYEKFHNAVKELAGTRITSSLAIGFYDSDFLGIYFPLKVGWLDAQWKNDRSATGFEFVPGIGFSFEKYGLVLRIAGNFAIPTKVGHADNSPYIGMQIGVRPTAIIKHISK
jgi:hypothetical protein